jgi:hypothetical protein
MTADDEFWDDLFHGCAWAAFLDEAAAEGGWPDQEATRRRAYRYYEDALAEKNGRDQRQPGSDNHVLTISAKRARIDP